MKILITLLLVVSSQLALAGTAIVCRPDGTCDVIITQDDGSSNGGGWNPHSSSDSR